MAAFSQDTKRAWPASSAFHGPGLSIFAEMTRHTVAIAKRMYPRKGMCGASRRSSLLRWRRAIAQRPYQEPHLVSRKLAENSRRYVIGEHRFSRHCAASRESEPASSTSSRFALDERHPTTSWALWVCSESARARVVHGDRAAAERLRRDQVRANQPGVILRIPGEPDRRSGVMSIMITG